MSTRPDELARDPVIALACELISRPSVTPEDAGCQALIAARLEQAGFQLEALDSGPVRNLLASRGQGGPHLMFVGHTDVVPPGPLEAWTSPPFEPSLREGVLYGRGAADMKGSVAAMVVALERLARSGLPKRGRLSLLLTSDEEGPALHGVRAVVPQLQARGDLPDFCLVGEPSSHKALGDVMRIGRRGSILARLRISGVQGHTAYTHAEDNPAHRAGALLAALGALDFADGDEAFPPTRLQISSLQAGTGAENVTPGELEIRFNLRNNPNSPAATLLAQLQSLIQAHDPGPWELDWKVNGVPFGPARGVFPALVRKLCEELLGRSPRADTGGGTSDGRFFGPLGIPVVELGPVNASIHQVNEQVAADDLIQLARLYEELARRLPAEMD